MQPECTFVQLPPDHPIFIRPEGESEKDFRSEWHKFIRKSKDSSFFVNPLPKFTSDIVLTKPRLKSLIENCLKTSPDLFDIGSKAIYSSNELKFSDSRSLMSDSYLTSFLYPYNSVTPDPQNSKVVAIGDMPTLVQRELQARALGID